MTLSSSIYYAGKPNPIQVSRQQEKSPKGLTIFAIIVCVILWASAFPAIRVALNGYTPTEVAFLRYIVASVVMTVYAIARRMPLPRVSDWSAIALCGFVGFTLYNVMLNAGEMTISAGTASFIISSEIGIIALLAWIFLGESLGKIGWIGVISCILGVGIIAFAKDSGFQFSSGALLIFMATLSISIYSVIQKPLLRRYSAIQFTTYAIWTGTLFLFFFAPKSIFSLPHAPIGSTLAVAYMGLFPGVIAYIAWSYVLSQIPASQAGSYLSLIPVAALLIAWLWLGEIPAPISLIGGMVILIGVFLVNKNTEKL